MLAESRGRQIACAVTSDPDNRNDCLRARRDYILTEIGGRRLVTAADCPTGVDRSPELLELGDHVVGKETHGVHHHLPRDR